MMLRDKLTVDNSLKQRVVLPTEREPLLLARVDAKLLQMMPKLQILLDKGNVTFNNINNNKRIRFRVLNFPRAAILDFMTSLCCPIVSNKRFQQ